MLEGACWTFTGGAGLPCVPQRGSNAAIREVFGERENGQGEGRSYTALPCVQQPTLTDKA